MLSVYHLPIYTTYYSAVDTYIYNNLSIINLFVHSCSSVYNQISDMISDINSKFFTFFTTDKFYHYSHKPSHNFRLFKDGVIYYVYIVQNCKTTISDFLTIFFVNTINNYFSLFIILLLVTAHR